MSPIAVISLLPVTLVMEPDVISLTLILAKQHQYMWILLLVNSIMTATSSNKELAVSVSFGKFENDSLSWEKFSSFSPNKYLEEVEKCATAGSVAQKKAYCESHYKKIAKRRADIIMEQNQNRGKTYDSDNDESMMIELTLMLVMNLTVKVLQKKISFLPALPIK
ncbi:PREDICTED: uncharacterized protein LOC104770540 [Camelina sativa]|uniref:Uncharacterized protein LOC104770540 n=1 Tax=Camelina sativa TaxID=90675 RepID=A0ABM0XZN2_CAMSA|nr:PREDICTED: uncharacterized protein LOC104770540 [Camelina sativa]